MSQGVGGRSGQTSSFHSEAGSLELRGLGLVYLSDCRVTESVSDQGVGRKVDRMNAIERRTRILKARGKTLGCFLDRGSGWYKTVRGSVVGCNLESTSMMVDITPFGLPVCSLSFITVRFILRGIPRGGTSLRLRDSLEAHHDGWRKS
jgi:hypothetical protein